MRKKITKEVAWLLIVSQILLNLVTYVAPVPSYASPMDYGIEAGETLLQPDEEAGHGELKEDHSDTVFSEDNSIILPIVQEEEQLQPEKTASTSETQVLGKTILFNDFDQLQVDGAEIGTSDTAQNKKMNFISTMSVLQDNLINENEIRVLNGEDSEEKLTYCNFKFIPDTTSVYIIRAAGKTVPYISVYDSDNTLGYNRTYPERSDSVAAKLYKGREYSIYLSSLSIEDPTELSVSKYESGASTLTYIFEDNAYTQGENASVVVTVPNITADIFYAILERDVVIEAELLKNRELIQKVPSIPAQNIKGAFGTPEDNIIQFFCDFGTVVDYGEYTVRVTCKDVRGDTIIAPCESNIKMANYTPLYIPSNSIKYTSYWGQTVYFKDVNTDKAKFLVLDGDKVIGTSDSVTVSRTTVSYSSYFNNYSSTYHKYDDSKFSKALYYSTIPDFTFNNVPEPGRKYAVKLVAGVSEYETPVEFIVSDELILNHVSCDSLSDTLKSFYVRTEFYNLDKIKPEEISIMLVDLSGNIAAYQKSCILEGYSQDGKLSMLRHNMYVDGTLDYTKNYRIRIDYPGNVYINTRATYLYTYTNRDYMSLNSPVILSYEDLLINVPAYYCDNTLDYKVVLYRNNGSLSIPVSEIPVTRPDANGNFILQFPQEGEIPLLVPGASYKITFTYNRPSDNNYPYTATTSFTVPLKNKDYDVGKNISFYPPVLAGLGEIEFTISGYEIENGIMGNDNITIELIADGEVYGSVDSNTIKKNAYVHIPNQTYSVSHISLTGSLKISKQLKDDTQYYIRINGTDYEYFYNLSQQVVNTEFLSINHYCSLSSFKSSTGDALIAYNLSKTESLELSLRWVKNTEEDLKLVLINAQTEEEVGAGSWETIETYLGGEYKDISIVADLTDISIGEEYAICIRAGDELYHLGKYIKVTEPLEAGSFTVQEAVYGSDIITLSLPSCVTLEGLYFDIKDSIDNVIACDIIPETVRKVSGNLVLDLKTEVPLKYGEYVIRMFNKNNQIKYQSSYTVSAGNKKISLSDIENGIPYLVHGKNLPEDGIYTADISDYYAVIFKEGIPLEKREGEDILELKESDLEGLPVGYYYVGIKLNGIYIGNLYLYYSGPFNLKPLIMPTEWLGSSSNEPFITSRSVEFLIKTIYYTGVRYAESLEELENTEYQPLTDSIEYEFKGPTGAKILYFQFIDDNGQESELATFRTYLKQENIITIISPKKDSSYSSEILISAEVTGEPGSVWASLSYYSTTGSLYTLGVYELEREEGTDFYSATATLTTTQASNLAKAGFYSVDKFGNITGFKEAVLKDGGGTSGGGTTEPTPVPVINDVKSSYNQANVTVSGKQASKGSNVTIYAYGIDSKGNRSGQTYYIRVLANENGEFQGTLNISKDGRYKIYAVDGKGAASYHYQTVVDTTVPVLKNSKMLAQSTNSVMLEWDVIDEFTCAYDIWKDGKLIQNNYNNKQYLAVGLVKGQTYIFTIIAVDIAGNRSLPVEIAVKVGDEEAPEKPLNLKVTSHTGKSITLSWDPSYDNSSGIGYEIYRDGEKVGTSYTTSYTDSNLITEREYSYTVRAFDPSYNYSPFSEALIHIPVTTFVKDAYDGSYSVVGYTAKTLTLRALTDDILNNDGIQVQFAYSRDGGSTWSTLGTAAQYTVTPSGLLFSMSWNIQYIQTGDYIIRYSMKDRDNCSHEAYSDTISILSVADTQAPSIVSIRPSPSCYSTSIPLIIKAQDDIGLKGIYLQGSLDGSVWTNIASVSVYNSNNYTWSYNLNVSGIREGTYYIRTIATDVGGNTSDDSASAASSYFIIDRTAPEKVKDIEVLSFIDYFEIRWGLNSEPYIGGFDVLRSESIDGNYTVVAQNLKSLNYFDEGLVPGKTYYYKVICIDIAGNKSEPSEPVKAVMLDVNSIDDSIPPQITSVYPDNNGVIGNKLTVAVTGKDDVKLSKITVEYSEDGGIWKELKTENFAYASGGFTAQMDTSLFKAGATLMIRAYAVDIKGNVSNYEYRNYTIDNVPPQKPVMEVKPIARGFEVSWSCEDTDISLYRVYRRNALSEFFTLVEECGRSVLKVSDKNLDPSNKYIYRVVAVDTLGNTSYSDSGAFSPLDIDDVFPSSYINCVSSAEAGMEIVFDGTASKDNVGIVKYSWNLGDGTVKEGATVIHSYEKEGEYTVALEVTDPSGNTSRAERKIRIIKKDNSGTLNISVVDSTGKALPMTNIYINVGEENQFKQVSDGSGNISLKLEPGAYKIGAYKEDYGPKQQEVLIQENKSNDLKFVLEQSQIIIGKMTATKLTLEEIKEAGIDVTAPGNQNVFRYEIKLEYNNRPYTINHISNSSNSYGSGSGSSYGSGYASATSYTVGDREIRVSTVGGDKTPVVVLLDIPGSATWLKDFFDVKLYMMNTQGFYNLEHCVVDLNIPEGISLVAGNDKTVNIGTIPANGDMMVNWILRGDKPGKYNLSADFNGIIESFNETVSARFTTENPIVVEDSSGLKFIIEVENIKYPGDDLMYRVGFKNEKNSDIYRPKISMEDSTFIRSYKTREDMSLINTSQEVLEPGEIQWSEFSVAPELFDGANATVKLQKFAAEALDGMKIPIEIRSVPYGTFGRLKANIYVIDPVTGREEQANLINLVRYRSKENDIMPDLKIKLERGISDDVIITEAFQFTIEDSLSGITEKVTTDENGEYIHKGGSIDDVEVGKSGTSTFSITVSSDTTRVKSSQRVRILDQNLLSSKDFGSVSGKLWDSDESMPISGATVIIESYSTISDSDGKFSFEDIMLTSDRVIVKAPGFPEKTIDKELNDGTYVFISLSRLPEITKVSTYISDSNNRRSAIIPLNLIDGSVSFWVDTDLKGAGEVSRYLYKIVDMCGNKKYEGESLSCFVTVENIRNKMSPGDRILFAIEAEGIYGSYTTEYVDAKLVMAKEFHFLNGVSWCNDMKEALNMPNPDIVKGLNGVLKFTKGEGLPEIKMPDDSGIFKSAALSTGKINFDFDVSYDFENAKAKFVTTGGIGLGADGELVKLKLGDNGKTKVGLKCENEATVSLECVYNDATLKWVVESMDIRFKSGITISAKFKYSVPLDATFGGALLSGYAAVTIDGKVENILEISIVDLSSFDSLEDIMVELQTIISLSLKAAIGAEVGYGLLSGEFWGKGTLSIALPGGRTELTLSYGYGYGYLWFFSGEETIDGKTWTLYEGNQKSARNLYLLSGIMNNESEDEEEGKLLFRSESREYLEDMQWLGKDEIIKSTYPRSDAQIFAIDKAYGDLIMVFVGDDRERTDNNRTSVFYSIYKDGKWSEPSQIENDGTGDAFLDLFADGDDIYAVWLDMSETLGELPPVSEDYITENVLGKMGVTVAKLDIEKGSWHNVMDERTEGVNKNPDIAGEDGKVLVTWVNNSGKKAIGTKEEPDSVYFVYNDGNGWKEPQAFITNASNVCESELYMHNGKAYYAFVTNAYSDEEIYKLYVATFDGKSWSSPRLVIDNKYNDSHPSIALQNGKPVVFWHNGGVIYSALIENSRDLHVAVNSGQAEELLELKAVNTDKGIALAWVNAVAGEQRLYISTYEEESSTWTQGTEISHNSLEIPRDITIAGLNDEIMVVYNKTAYKLDEEEQVYYREGTSLTSVRYTRKTDLAIPEGGLYFETDAVFPGEEARVIAVVENVGDLTATGIKVSLYDGDKLIGVKDMPDAGLSHGNTQLVSFDWKIPEDCSGFELMAVLESSEDSNPLNNTCQLEVSYTDAEVIGVYNELYTETTGYVYVDVRNSGYSSIENARVYISEDREFENIIGTKEIKNIYPLDTKTAVFALEVTDEQIEDRARVYAKVEVEPTETNYQNNFDFTVIRPLEMSSAITPSPTPSTTPSTTPSPTPSPTPSTTPSPTPSTTPSTTPSPTSSTTPSPTPSTTPSTTPTPTPSKTSSKTPSPISTPKPVDTSGQEAGGGEGTPSDGGSTGGSEEPGETPGSGDVNEPTEPKGADAEPGEIPSSGEIGEPKAYMRGYEDNSFRPENRLTRAEMAVILAGINGAPKGSPEELNFKDVSREHWAAGAIAYVSEKGYFKGYGDNDFRPDQYITRGELSVVLCKYMGLEAVDTVNEFSFNDINGHWAQMFINRLLQEGYIKGYPDETFRPDSNIKRSECVAVINRILGIEPIKDAEPRFTDVDKDYWAFGDIMAATLQRDE